MIFFVLYASSQSEQAAMQPVRANELTKPRTKSSSTCSGIRSETLLYMRILITRWFLISCSLISINRSSLCLYASWNAGVGRTKTSKEPYQTLSPPTEVKRGRGWLRKTSVMPTKAISGGRLRAQPCVIRVLPPPPPVAKRRASHPICVCPHINNTHWGSEDSVLNRAVYSLAAMHHTCESNCVYRTQQVRNSAIRVSNIYSITVATVGT